MRTQTGFIGGRNISFRKMQNIHHTGRLKSVVRLIEAVGLQLLDSQIMEIICVVYGNEHAFY